VGIPSALWEGNTPLPADRVLPSDSPLPAGEGPTLAQAAEALRGELGDTAFDAAWAVGQAMSLDQAVAHALENPPVSCPGTCGGSAPVRGAPEECTTTSTSAPLP
jgi:hypothetical protein